MIEYKTAVSNQDVHLEKIMKEVKVSQISSPLESSADSVIIYEP